MAKQQITLHTARQVLLLPCLLLPLFCDEYTGKIKHDQTAIPKGQSDSHNKASNLSIGQVKYK